MAKFLAVCLVLLAVTGAASADKALGRTLKTLKKATLLPVVVTTAPAATVAAPAVTISPFGKLLAKTGLVVGGGAAAAAATPAAPVDPAPRQEQPAAATPAASTSGARAPAPQLPPPRPVAGNNDIGRALQCQSAFNGLGGRTGVEALLGDVCREGSASFDALGCCQKTASVLNGGTVRGCACNNLVYNQLCQEVKIQGLTCANLRGQLIACGMQC